MLTKEEILDVLHDNITMDEIRGLEGLEDAAEQILLLMQPNSEPQLQLNKHDVSRSVYVIEYSSIGKDYKVKVEGCDMKDALSNFHKDYQYVDAVHSITAAE